MHIYLLFLTMWTYNRQIIWRWIFFIAAAFILSVGFFWLSQPYPEGIGRAEVKAFATTASVYFEFLPFYWFGLIFFAILSLLMLGCPLVLIFAVLYFLTGFLTAFTTTLLAQGLASMLAIHISRKLDPNKRIPFGLISSIIATGTSAEGLTFWGRLYLSYPLRTIDLLTAALLSENSSLLKISMISTAATAIRNLLPTIWVTVLIDLLTEIQVNPAQQSANFLFWSALLVAFIGLPKVPELMICKTEIKPVLQDIECWNVVKASSKDNAKRTRSKIKLGMQPRPG